MNSIPPIFWMIIVSVLTVMLSFIFYHVAMLIRETKLTVKDARETMREVNKVLQKVDLIINNVQESVAMVRGTVEEINQGILAPVRKIAGFTALITGILSHDKDKKTDEHNE